MRRRPDLRVAPRGRHLAQDGELKGMGWSGCLTEVKGVVRELSGPLRAVAVEGAPIATFLIAVAIF